MSWWVYLLDEETNTCIDFDVRREHIGGVYAVGGTNEAEINITYNYAPHFTGLGPKGLRSLHGKTARETIPALKSTIRRLADDIDPDYWAPTEGNAKRALKALLEFAEAAPDGVWDVS